MGLANGFCHLQCKRQVRTHKTCSCIIVTAGQREDRLTSDKDEIGRDTPTQIKAPSGSSVVG